MNERDEVDDVEEESLKKGKRKKNIFTFSLVKYKKEKEKEKESNKVAAFQMEKTSSLLFSPDRDVLHLTK